MKLTKLEYVDNTGDNYFGYKLDCEDAGGNTHPISLYMSGLLCLTKQITTSEEALKFYETKLTDKDFIKLINEIVDPNGKRSIETINFNYICGVKHGLGQNKRFYYHTYHKIIFKNQS